MPGSYDDNAPLRAGDPGQAQDGQATTIARVPIRVIEPDRTARGGIVLLHESREFAETLLELMRALSAEGWIVVAPNLFHRGADDDQIFGEELFADFDACFDWLVRRGVYPDLTGVLGFDSAGTAAFLVATNRRIGAAVSISAPGIDEPLTDRADALIRAAAGLQAPWLGLYGSDDPLDQVERLREAAAGAAVATLVVSYPGLRHRPDRTGTDSDADDVVSAHARIFDWFDSHLR